VRHVPLAALISREWRTSWADRGAYILRAAYAGALLAGTIAAWVLLPLVGSGNPDEYPEIIRSGFGMFCRGQFVLATMLAAMTFARAVCREQERGTLDFLILSPLTRTEILVGKLAGEFLGLTALVASGIPVLFLLIPLGGVSIPGILWLQVTILAQVLVVGGVCVALAAAIGRTFPVMLVAWALMVVAAIGHAVGRWWWPKSAVVWNLWESISVYDTLGRQLSRVQTEAGPAFKALAAAAVVSILCCAMGSLVLEKRFVRGVRVGMWSQVAARVRRFAGSLSGAWLFRPLIALDHPLVRRECAIYRDLPFRFCWMALVIGYAIIARNALHDSWGRWGDHAELASKGLGIGAVLAVLMGAITVGYDRRRGNLQTMLACGVAPEDIVRARMAGLVLRALHLMGLPVIHLALVSIPAGLCPPGEMLWRLPAALTGLLLGTIVMMDFTLKYALSFRRPEVAGVMAVLFALPLGALCMGFVGATFSTFSIGLPLLIVAILASGARNIRKLPKWVMR